MHQRTKLTTITIFWLRDILAKAVLPLSSPCGLDTYNKPVYKDRAALHKIVAHKGHDEEGGDGADRVPRG